MRKLTLRGVNSLLQADGSPMAQLGFKLGWAYSEFCDFAFQTWHCNTSRRQQGGPPIQQDSPPCRGKTPSPIPISGGKTGLASQHPGSAVQGGGLVCDGNQPLAITGGSPRCHMCPPQPAGTHRLGCCGWRHPLAFSGTPIPRAIAHWYDLVNLKIGAAGRGS